MTNVASITELTKKTYNKLADKYYNSFKDEINQKEFDRDLLNNFSQSLPDYSLILDVGCGPAGHIGRYLFEKGHNVLGIDLSENCIEIAKRENPEMIFEVVDMMEMRFPESHFNAIISYYSIIYTPKEYLNKLFSDFYKILKPGGKLLVVVKKGDYEGFFEDEEWYKSTIYYTFFNEEDIRSLLERNCFSIELLKTRNPYENEIQYDRIYSIGVKMEKG